MILIVLSITTLADMQYSSEYCLYICTPADIYLKPPPPPSGYDRILKGGEKIGMAGRERETERDRERDYLMVLTHHKASHHSFITLYNHVT